MADETTHSETDSKLPPSRESSLRHSTLLGKTELESNTSANQPERRLSAKKRSVARFLLPISSSSGCNDDEETPSQSGVTRRSIFSVFGTSATPIGERDSVRAPGEVRESTHSGAARTSRRSFLDNGEEHEALQRFAAANFRHSVSSMASSVSLGVVGDRWSLLGFQHRAQRARLQLWLFLEEPYLTAWSTVFSMVMVSVIVASISCSVVWWSFESEAVVANTINVTFNVVFCAELLIRIWAFPLPMRFLWHPKNAIDSVAILPFLVNDIIAVPSLSPRVSFVRWLSAYEAFLRLLKLSRYFWGWQLLFRAICDSAKALVVPLFFLVVIVIFGSCTVYVFEKLEEETRDDDALVCDLSGNYEIYINECVSIRTLPDAIHFSVVCILSLSTGPFYGMQAISAVGQAMVCTLMVFGMVFMAMPIAIVGSCFAQTWFDRDRIVLLEKVRSRLQAQGYTAQDIHDVFDEVDADGSGEIEFDEFRKMIRSFNLRSLNVAKCRHLFHYFDTDCDGVINFMDFSLTLYPELPVEVDEYSRAYGNTESDAIGEVQDVQEDPDANDDEPEKTPVGTQSAAEKTLPSLLSTTGVAFEKLPKGSRSAKKRGFAQSTSTRGEEMIAYTGRDIHEEIDAHPPPGQPPLLPGCASTNIGEDDLQSLHPHGWRPGCAQMSVVGEEASFEQDEEEFHRKNWRQSCASETSWRSSCSSRLPGLSVGMSDFSCRSRDPSFGGSLQPSGLRQLNGTRVEVLLQKMEARLERRIDQIMSAVVRYQSGQIASPNVGLSFLQGFGQRSIPSTAVQSAIHSQIQSRSQSRSNSICAPGSARSSRRNSIFSTMTSVRLPPPTENKKRLRRGNTGPLRNVKAAP